MSTLVSSVDTIHKSRVTTDHPLPPPSSGIASNWILSPVSRSEIRTEEDVAVI